MSDTCMLELQTENKNLKQQLENNSKGVESLLAHMDAHKQLLNEQLQNGLALRSNLILVQKRHQELETEVNDLKKKLADATANTSKSE